ncbi:MAG: DUF3194 domain-containing protein [Methanosphaera sp.]|uniref:DUF3194 domain-containing protein n=1 Tax=Methanosphaera sp. TaxID=2666342 RepID=UPI0025E4CF69|nr:DUF3194 domain-containing protein [Methanosphaera sp.]MCI5867364.1 DUF3194 domain-containing protein [Methanosphaera sp.]MDD6534568.1 DUF3194 domain-containing protein [Methanosphaera sp.]MDY3955763.1 DUF3194 domain-containing protein [Methanosphaera sp.]
MIKLTQDEADEIIKLAHNTAEKYILDNVNKKQFEDINIMINLKALEDSFDIDINIKLDSDVELPSDLSQKAIDLSLDAVDEYVQARKERLNDY